MRMKPGLKSENGNEVLSNNLQFMYYGRATMVLLRVLFSEEIKCNCDRISLEIAKDYCNAAVCQCIVCDLIPSSGHQRYHKPLAYLIFVVM